MPQKVVVWKIWKWNSDLVSYPLASICFVVGWIKVYPKKPSEFGLVAFATPKIRAAKGPFLEKEYWACILSPLNNDSTNGSQDQGCWKKNHQSVIILIICFSLFHGKRLKDAIFAVEPFLAHFSSTLCMTQQIWWKSSCLHVVHFVQCYTAFSKCKTIFMNMLLPKGLYLNLLRSLYYSYEQR